MSLNNLPFSMDDVDPETDVFRGTFSESDSDDAQGTLVDSPESGSIWFVRAGFTGVSIGDEDFNDGNLYINAGGFNPGPTDSNLQAMRRISDDLTGKETIETYVRGSEVDEIEVGVYFPNAAFDFYPEIGVYGEAVRLRRGHALEPKAFSPNQTVQTFDGTVDNPASFSSPTMITDSNRTYYTHYYDDDGDNRTESADYVAEIPEYTDADNPVVSFEIRYESGTGTSWPSDWEQLSEVGALPQSDNQDGWPITALLEANDEVPPPNCQNFCTTTYEVRAVVWEAGAKAETRAESDPVSVTSSDASDFGTA